MRDALVHVGMVRLGHGTTQTVFERTIRTLQTTYDSHMWANFFILSEKA